MASPLNGVGTQQIPLATPFKPGQTEDQSRTGNQQQTKKIGTSESNQTDTRNREDLLEQQLAAALSTQRQGGEVRRGSVVDITV